MTPSFKAVAQAVEVRRSTALAAALGAALAAACCGVPTAAARGGVFAPHEGAPTYHALDGYAPRWQAQVEDGVDMARAFWGSYGPVHVWIAGEEPGQGSPAGARDAFVDDYCRWRGAGAEHDPADLRRRATERFLDVVERGDAEAYLSWVDELEQPAAELVFLNVHKWWFARDPIPDPTLRGVHEYTHVFQKAFALTPTWMMEGGAVFAEAWVPYIAGRCDQDVMVQRLLRSAKQAQRATEQGFSIADMEDIDRASEGARGFYRELAYDAGAWAIVALVHRSPSKSVTALRDAFYPMVDVLGWQRALRRYLGLAHERAFYREVEALLAAPVARQRSVLLALRR